MKSRVHPSLWHSHSLGPPGAETPTLVLSFISGPGDVGTCPWETEEVSDNITTILITTYQVKSRNSNLPPFYTGGN